MFLLEKKLVAQAWKVKNNLIFLSPFMETYFQDFMQLNQIIFLLKNLAIILIRYLELRIIKIFREDCSKNLFNHFLTMPYSYYLNTNTAVTIRTINADITHAFSLLLAKIRLIRECILLIFIVTALIYIDPLTYSLSFLFFTFVAVMFYYFYKKVITSRALDVMTFL